MELKNEKGEIKKSKKEARDAKIHLSKGSEWKIKSCAI